MDTNVFGKLNNEETCRGAAFGRQSLLAFGATCRSVLESTNLNLLSIGMMQQTSHALIVGLLRA